MVLSKTIEIAITALLLLAVLYLGVQLTNTALAGDPLDAEFNKYYDILIRLDPGDTVPLRTVESKYIIEFYSPAYDGKPVPCGKEACMCIFTLGNRVTRHDCKRLSDIKDTCSTRDSCFAKKIQQIRKPEQEAEEPIIFFCMDTNNKITIKQDATC